MELKFSKASQSYNQTYLDPNFDDQKLSNLLYKFLLTLHF